MGYGVSSFIVKWANFLTLGVSFCILGLGIWLSSRDGDCDKFLTVPALTLGAFVFIISLLGLVGAWKNLVWVLCVYLVIMSLLLVGLALFTAFAFIVTNEGAGRVISGQGFKEYNLGDSTGYIRRLFNNPQNWKHLQDCLLLNPDYCAQIVRDYESIAELQNAQLNSIQSGCCRPPAECKFPLVNVTYYNLTSRYVPEAVQGSSFTSTKSTTFPSPSPPPPNSSSPSPPLILVTAQITAMINLTRPSIPDIRVSTATSTSDLQATGFPTTEYASQYRKYNNPDCITFENDRNTKCFECNSCKAGVANLMKKDWRLVALINIAVFVLLVTLYAFGCCARRNALRAKYTKV